MMTDNYYWTCPYCGNSFFNRNKCNHEIRDILHAANEARAWARKIYRIFLILDSQRASDQATISQLRTKLEDIESASPELFVLAQSHAELSRKLEVAEEENKKQEHRIALLENWEVNFRSISGYYFDSIRKLDNAKAENAALRRKLEELQPGIEKVEEISEQFRCGMAGYDLGSEIDDKPHGDAWRVGYAWAAYYDLTTSVAKGKRENANLRSKLEIAEEAFRNILHGSIGIGYGRRYVHALEDIARKALAAITEKKEEGEE